MHKNEKKKLYINKLYINFNCTKKIMTEKYIF